MICSRRSDTRLPEGHAPPAPRKRQRAPLRGPSGFHRSPRLKPRGDSSSSDGDSSRPPDAPDPARFRRRDPPLRVSELQSSLQPPAGKSRAPQSITEVTALARQIPDKPGSIIFNHQHGQPLVETELAFRYPAPPIRLGHRCIQAIGNAEVAADPRILIAEMPDCRHRDLRRKRQRAENHRRMNRAGILTNRRAPGHVIKIPADGTVDCHRPDARTFARAEAPVVISVSLVSAWIADGV